MNSSQEPVLVAEGLGWPEGPTIRLDGSVIFVECYRSQLSIVGGDGEPRQFAYVTGAPNSCVLGASGELYICQNGGTVGPWRAAEMTAPSIQRVREGGEAEILVTEIDGIKCNGPNDLVFAADGRLIFTDPGTYNLADPDPSYIFSIGAGWKHKRRRRVSRAGLPQRGGRRGGRLDPVGRVLHRPCRAPAARRNHGGPRPYARRQPHTGRYEGWRRRPYLCD